MSDSVCEQMAVPCFSKSVTKEAQNVTDQENTEGHGHGAEDYLKKLKIRTGLNQF